MTALRFLLHSPFNRIKKEKSAENQTSHAAPIPKQPARETDKGALMSLHKGFDLLFAHRHVLLSISATNCAFPPGNQRKTLLISDLQLFKNNKLPFNMF